MIAQRVQCGRYMMLQAMWYVISGRAVMKVADRKTRLALSVTKQGHTYMVQEKQSQRSKQMRRPKTKQ